MSGSLRPDMGFVSDEATAQSPLKEGGGVGARTTAHILIDELVKLMSEEAQAA